MLVLDNSRWKIGNDKKNPDDPQQEQMQNGVHKSISWSWLAWFELNSTPSFLSQCSLSEHGNTESIVIKMDNMRE